VYFGVQHHSPRYYPGYQQIVAPPNTVLPVGSLDQTQSSMPVSPIGPGFKLAIPSLGVDASIVPEGIDTSAGDVGNLAIPYDVHAGGLVGPGTGARPTRCSCAGRAC